MDEHKVEELPLQEHSLYTYFNAINILNKSASTYNITYIASEEAIQKLKESEGK